MRLIQKKGPFSAGASFTAGGTTANEFVHLGIQLPKCQPLSINNHNTPGLYDSAEKSADYKTVYKEKISPDIRVKQNTHILNFFINETGILEFDGEMGTAITVTFLKDMPVETIVDLVYKVQGE